MVLSVYPFVCLSVNYVHENSKHIFQNHFIWTPDNLLIVSIFNAFEVTLIALTVQSKGRGFESYQRCAIFYFIKFWLFDEKLFTVKMGAIACTW